MQITEAPIHATLAVTDLDRARSWYADKLGWEPVLEVPGTLVYQVRDSFFTLFVSPFAGTAENTVMNWTVDDVGTVVAGLRDRGLVFEEYDFGEVKTADGIMTDSGGGQNAWLKDPDGNIVGIISAPDGAPGIETSSVSPMIAASDLERAKGWYADRLGFEPVFEYPGVVLTYASGDTSFTVYATRYAGTAKNTVAIWRMPGIRDEVARLRARGVVFDEWDLGEDGKTVEGILSDEEGDANAWFRDSEGNILSLAEDRGGFPG